MNRVALSIVVAALSLAPLPSAAAGWDGTWFTSTTGGSTVELPSFLEGVRAFMVEGIDHGTDFVPDDGSSFWAQQFWVETDKRPYAFILARWSDSTSSISYKVNHTDIGVLSGIENDERGRAFYEICRRAGALLRCVSMGWNISEQARSAKLVTHIVASFKE